MMSKYIIFDLDHTLLYTRKFDYTEKIKLNDNDFLFPDIYTEDLLIATKRKHLDETLQLLREEGYKIIVWSAGIDAYVKYALSVILKNFPVEYILTKTNMTSTNINGIEELTKDIRIIKNYISDFNVENARLVDDIEINGYLNPDKFIHMKPFSGESEDELLKLPERLRKSFSN